MLCPNKGFDQGKFNYSYAYDSKNSISTIKVPYFYVKDSSYKIIKKDYPIDRKFVFTGDIDIDHVMHFMKESEKKKSKKSSQKQQKPIRK